MENSASYFGQHIPSFSQNSCPGISAEEATAEGDSSENSEGNLTRPSPGLSDNNEKIQEESGSFKLLEESPAVFLSASATA